MVHTDSDDDVDDVEYDMEEEQEQDLEDEGLLDGIEVADDATEDGEEDSASDDSDDASDDDDEDASEPSMDPAMLLDFELASGLHDDLHSQDALGVPPSTVPPSSHTSSQPSKPPSPVPAPSKRLVVSIEDDRRRALRIPLWPGVKAPRTFTVEAICALPHPVPTHSLASTPCVTHLLTGSDDGYIRDYDVFSALNGKTFLSAPQRHHAGVVEGILKAGQLRFWWENPANIRPANGVQSEDDHALAPALSLAIHSDAIWALAGTDVGNINLFTVRHEPGRLCHVFTGGHRNRVSALSLDHDEKSLFSVGWDAEALQWDLNTGQIVRNFNAHSAQLSGIAVRPTAAVYHADGSPVVVRHDIEPANAFLATQDDNRDMIVDQKPITSAPPPSSIPQGQPAVPDPPPDQTDAKSEASYDPLFDDDPLFNEDVPDRAAETPEDTKPMTLLKPGESLQPKQPPRAAAAPRNAPPLLERTNYTSFSPDILMTVYIDGQIILWDKRAHTSGTGVGRLWMSERTPPWCLSACWSADGSQIYAGRRNETIDIWDVRQLGLSSDNPKLLKTLRNPPSSGPVSSVASFPDGRHIACASVDNLRLWNVAEANEPDASGKMKSGVQFKIIPGHHGGTISQMLVDPGARFLDDGGDDAVDGAEHALWGEVLTFFLPGMWIELVR
ncbi:hypothetical protein ONZ45_g8311 [Pleurotus djamor]|nr:hypothetical protein ONZ45_g8311 [Pleurotus djamor]